MLNPSRLYTFLHPSKRFSFTFFEAQKFIYDMFTVHPLPAASLNYFREVLLSSHCLIHFLKPGENIGVYIDSDEPYFRLKIETGFSGKSRSLLLPEVFDDFPKKVNGLCRIIKFNPHQQTPYSSIIKLENDSYETMINQIFKSSYQMDSTVKVSDIADQSLMICRLPSNEYNKPDELEKSSNDLMLEHEEFIKNLFNSSFNEIQNIVPFFENLGFEYLNSKQIEFYCPCNKEQFISSLTKLTANHFEDLFKNEDSIEVKCDYCKTFYNITKDDFLNEIN